MGRGFGILAGAIACAFVALDAPGFEVIEIERFGEAEALIREGSTVLQIYRSSSVDHPAAAVAGVTVQQEGVHHSASAFARESSVVKPTLEDGCGLLVAYGATSTSGSIPATAPLTAEGTGKAFFELQFRVERPSSLRRAAVLTAGTAAETDPEGDFQAEARFEIREQGSEPFLSVVHRSACSETPCGPGRTVGVIGPRDEASVPVSCGETGGPAEAVFDPGVIYVVEMVASVESKSGAAGFAGGGASYELWAVIEPALASVLGFFDDAVEHRLLEGMGPGASATRRLRAFREMLIDADEMLGTGMNPEACGQLHAALLHGDGAPRPLDFVAGPAQPELAQRIRDAREDLECP